EPRRGGVQRDRRLRVAEPGGHQRRARRQVPRPELQPDRDAAHLPVVELEPWGELRPVVHVRADAGVMQPGRQLPDGRQHLVGLLSAAYWMLKTLAKFVPM